MPHLVDLVEYQRGDLEWSIGVVENTTDIYVQKRRIVNSPEEPESNIYHITSEIVGELLFEYAERELEYVEGNTRGEKYLALFEYNMRSSILRPQMELVIDGLVEVPDHYENNHPLSDIEEDPLDENNHPPSDSDCDIDSDEENMFVNNYESSEDEWDYNPSDEEWNWGEDSDT